MPRALVLCEYATLNGGERSLLAVLPRLQRADWEFDFLAPREGALADALHERAVAIVGRHDEITDVLSRRSYDLVHANSLAMSLHLGMRAEQLGIPTLGHLRDIVRLSANKIAQLNRNARLLAVSEAARTHHIAQGLDAAKTHALHNGIDTTIFLPSPLVGEGPGVGGDVGEILVLGSSFLVAGTSFIVAATGSQTSLRNSAPAAAASSPTPNVRRQRSIAAPMGATGPSATIATSSSGLFACRTTNATNCRSNVGGFPFSFDGVLRVNSKKSTSTASGGNAADKASSVISLPASRNAAHWALSRASSNSFSCIK